MQDALVFIMVLPGLVLALLVANAAGERGAATYRAESFAVAAVDHAAEEIGADPANAALWEQTSAAVSEYARLSTWGACLQDHPDFHVGVYRQPEAPAPPASAAVLVSCPISSTSVFTDDTVTALAVRQLD